MHILYKSLVISIILCIYVYVVMIYSIVKYPENEIQAGYYYNLEVKDSGDSELIAYLADKF